MPVSVIIRENVREWMAVVFKHITEEHTSENIAKVWQDTVTELATLAPAKLTTHIKGVLSNIVTLLMRCKWKPYKYNEWIMPQGTPLHIQYTHDNKDSIKAISSLLIDSQLAIDCFRASDHYNGFGMERGGVDWFASMRLIKKL